MCYRSQVTGFRSFTEPPAARIDWRRRRRYRKTKNLRAVQLLPGHTRLESTVRNLGIEVDDALDISEQADV